MFQKSSDKNEELNVEQNKRITMLSSEQDRKLKQLVRSKSFSRSLRRAQTVYYRNRRSKSLEDLASNVEREKFLACEADSIERRLSKRGGGDVGSMNSSLASSRETGLVSDISSSCFHDLSDWSPEISGGSSSSENELFDWDGNLSISALV